MLNLPAAFAGIASRVTAVCGAPYWPAQINTATPGSYDDSGAFVPGGSAVARPCQAQVDNATEAMRQAVGFTEQDRAIIILSATLEGGVTTDDTITILSGPFAGKWLIAAVSRDPAFIGFALTGRPA